MTEYERLVLIMEADERAAKSVRRTMLSYMFLGFLGFVGATICLIYGIRNPDGMFEIHNIAIIIIGYALAISAKPCFRMDAMFYLTRLEGAPR